MNIKKPIDMEQPTITQRPDSAKAQKGVKASPLSSNPINEIPNSGHASCFEVEVHNAFFKVFGFNCAN